jgi:predicted nucleic acid-binding protein
LLGWYQATSDELLKLNGFVKEAHIFALDEQVILKTIELRQGYRLKTPDAIIAATAIINNISLISRNSADFKNIEGLAVINPWEL